MGTCIYEDGCEDFQPQDKIDIPSSVRGATFELPLCKSVQEIACLIG